jgi:thiol-disulfide isomerase/thioredoxin
MHMLLLTPMLVGLLAAPGDEKAPAESYPVRLEPGSPESKLAPRFSPYGKQIPLTAKAMPGLAGSDHLEGRIRLGPQRDKGPGQLIVLARSGKDKPYDLLFIDAGHDGSVTDDKPLSAATSMSRGNLWSSFTATLKVNHAAPGQPAAWQEYPVSFWAVVEKADETPRVIRFSRRGYLTGSVTVAGVVHDVILSDANNDGVFGPGDWWTVREATNKNAYSPAENREVGDFAWSGGKAWKLELEGTDGRKGRLVRFLPDVTQEEDASHRDKLRDDRLAPRAKQPVKFQNDVDETLKGAPGRKQSVFLKFETDWCGPCKQMDQLVFTAQAVAEAAEGIVCLKVDGDKRKDLRAKYKVDAFPTGILFGPDGKEVARYVGYRSVKEMTAFFRKVKP